MKDVQQDNELFMMGAALCDLCSDVHVFVGNIEGKEKVIDACRKWLKINCGEARNVKVHYIE